MSLLKLFWSFFQVGLFSFGGGYAAMPFIQEQVVSVNGWLTMEEFIDVLTISQMTPGPIAINAATFVGMRVDGVLGAVVATVGTVTPSFFIVLTLAWIYYKYRSMWMIKGILKGLRPAVVALIASAGLSILLIALFHGVADSWLQVTLSTIDPFALLLVAGSLFCLLRFKLDPILVMSGAGVLGLIAYFL